jgi:hypothetical protein
MEMKKLLAICLVAFVVSATSANPATIALTSGFGQSLQNIQGMVNKSGTGAEPFPSNELTIPNIAVSITNLTYIGWRELHYVADPKTTLQNYDQNQLNSQLAFRIDYNGSNTPLISESGNTNLIPEHKETWVLVIQDYFNTKGLSAAVLGSSMGVPGAGDSYSLGSIIAIPKASDDWPVRSRRYEFRP